MKDDYLGIKLERVWEVVERDLPPLEEHVKRVLQGIEGKPGRK